MAETDINISLGADKSSLTALRKNLEASLSNVSLSVSEKSFSSISKQISKNVTAGVSVVASNASLKSMAKQVSAGLSNINVRLVADQASIDRIKGAIGKTTSKISLDLNSSQIKGLGRILSEAKKGFDDISASKDRFAANVQQKFPAIISQIKAMNDELAKAQKNFNALSNVNATNKPNVTQSPNQASNQPGNLGTQVAGAQQANSKATKQSIKDTKEYQDAVAAASKVQDQFAFRIGNTTARLAAYLLPAGAIFQLARGFAFAKQNIVELDTELNKLTQILDNQSRGAVSDIASEILKLGTAYGQSGAEVLKTANVLAQAGNKFGGTGKAIIDVTDQIARTKLAATFGDVTETTEGLIAIMGQFNLEASDTNRILDVANQLSKKFAFEAGDLFEGVRVGGKSFQIAGGDIEEFASVLAGLRELTRLPTAQLATGINAISLRSLRPEVIRYTEQLTASVGGIRKQDGTLLDLVDRWRQIAKATKDYDNEALGPVIEKISDIRQAKVFAPLLKDLQKGDNAVTNKALDETKKGVGSFNRDVATGLERLDVQLGSIGARFQEVFKSLGENKEVRNLVRDFATLAKSMASAVEAVGPLLPLLIRLGAVKLGFNLIRGFTPFLAGLKGSKASVVDLMAKVKSATQGSGPGLQNVSSAGAGTSVASNLSQTRVIQQNTAAQNKNTVAVSMAATKGGASQFFTKSAITGSKMPVSVNTLFPQKAKIFGNTTTSEFGDKSLPLSVLNPKVPSLRSSTATQTNQNFLSYLAVPGGPKAPVRKTAIDLEVEKAAEQNRLNRNIDTFGNFRSRPKGSDFGPLTKEDYDFSEENRAKLLQNATVKKYQAARNIGIKNSRESKRASDFAGLLHRPSNANFGPLSVFQTRKQASLFGAQQTDEQITSDIQKRNIGISSRNAVAQTSLPLYRAGKSFFLSPSEGDINSPRGSLSKKLAEDRARYNTEGVRNARSNVAASESLTNKIMDLQAPKAAMIKKINAMTIQLDKNQKTLIASGLSEAEVKVELDKYREQLNRQIGALLKLEAAENDAARKLRNTNTAGTPITPGAAPSKPGLGSRLGSAAKSTKGALKSAAGTYGFDIGATVAYAGLSKLSESFASDIKPIVDENGKTSESLSGLSDSVKNNISAATKSGAASGAANGALIGGVAAGAIVSTGGLATPVVLTAAGVAALSIGIGSAIGGVVGRTDSQKAAEGDLLGAAAVLGPKKNGAALVAAFKQISDNGNLNERGDNAGISSGFVAKNLSEASSNLGTVVPTLKEAAKIFGIGNGSQGSYSSIQEDFRSSLGTEGGKQFVGSLGKRAREIAVEVGRSGSTDQVGGKVRQKLIEETKASIVSVLQQARPIEGLSKEQIAERNKKIDVDATQQASIAVAEGLREAGLAGEGASEKLDTLAKEADTTAKKVSALTENLLVAFSGASDTMVLAAARMRDFTREISRNTLNNAVSSQSRSQFANSALTGGVSQIPQQLGLAMSENLQAAISQASGITPQEQRSKIDEAISRIGAGSLGTKEQKEIGDFATIGKFAKSISETVGKGLSTTIIGTDDPTTISKKTGEVVSSLIETSGIKDTLKTTAGVNQLNQMTADLQKAAKERPEEFTADPAAFASKFLGDYAEGKNVLDRFNANIENANQKLEAMSAAQTTALKIQESLNQFESQSFNTRLGQAKQGGKIGATSSDIISGISSLIGRSGASTDNLSALSDNVRKAREATLPFAGRTLNPEEAKQFGKVSLALERANAAYTDELNRSQNSLQAFRSRLEQVSKELAGINATQRAVGQSTVSDLSSSTFQLGVLQSIASPLIEELRKAGVSNAEQLNTLSPEERNRLQGLAGSFAGSEVFTGALKGTDTLNGALLPGTNQNIGDLKDILSTLAGGNQLEAQGFGTTNARANALGAIQKSDFATIADIENRQLSSLSTINDSIIQLGRTIIMATPSGIMNDQQKQANLAAFNASAERSKGIINSAPPIINNTPTPSTPLPNGQQGQATPNQAQNDAIAALTTQLAETTAALKASQNSSTIIDKLNTQLSALADAINNNGGSLAISLEGNINIEGADNAGKGEAIKGVVVFIVNQFIKKLDRSDPTQDVIATNLQNAIKQIEAK